MKTLRGLSIALAMTSVACQSQSGIVAAASPEAVEAGMRVLDAGGNAIDAAVAVSFALGVTEPAMSGLGGQSQILMHPPEGDPIVINGTSYAPRTIPDGVAPGDLAAHRLTTVPTTVNTLGYALERYGSGALPWADLLEPAIEYAEDGFVVGPFRAKVWQTHVELLGADSATAAFFLTADGDAPANGALWTQPALAATLRRLATAGPGDFYTGGIAAEIAADMGANGGWLTEEDLAAVGRPTELTPLHGTYRGYDVYSLPPPGGGWVVLQILNVLEQTPAASLQLASPARGLRVAEALRVGHVSRRHWPVTNLREYSADVGARISKDSAAALLTRSREGGETTHFTIVDRDGMVVTVTASINAYFGARRANPTLGFLYNSYMSEFELDAPDHPFALRGNAMPYSSMSPTIVARDGRPLLGLGSPGSSRIISAVAQVTHLWIDAGLTITDAVAAPRIHVVPDNDLYLEAPGVGSESTAERGGFVIQVPGTDYALGDLNAYFGGVHAVAFEDGRWVGAADPRRDGMAVKAVKR